MKDWVFFKTVAARVDRARFKELFISTQNSMERIHKKRLPKSPRSCDKIILARANEFFCIGGFIYVQIVAFNKRAKRLDAYGKFFHTASKG